MAKRVKMEERVGQIYGRLVIDSVYRDGNRSYAECSCSCGNKLTTRIDSLQSGVTISCGCYSKERVSEIHSTHKLSESRTYTIWDGMKRRCDNVNSDSYESYGGRGIKYDTRWSAFENFVADMGEVPKGMSLDRVDNNGNYCKENCRWTSDTIQARNRGKRKNCKNGDFVGVYFDHRAKTGGWFFKAHKDYKSVGKYCQSEGQAAAYYNYCSAILYQCEVAMNPVDYILSQQEQNMLDGLILKKFPEVFNKGEPK